MTATLARASATRQDWRRHALALVLFFVLVWYTVVSPSYTAAPLRAADDDAPDAEEREIEARAAGLSAAPRVALGLTPRAGEFAASGDEDELDWPEIIGDD